MRVVLSTLVLLTAGADYAQHRRFLQRPLPSSSCEVGSPTTASWRNFGTAATITLNDALSPACLVDATRVQFPSAVGTHSTYWTPAASIPCTAGTGAPATLQYWVKGKTAAGTIGACVVAQVGSYNCGTCAFTASAYTHCSYTTAQNMSAGGGVGDAFVGLTGTLPVFGTNPGPTTAIDVEVWGLTCT